MLEQRGAPATCQTRTRQSGAEQHQGGVLENILIGATIRRKPGGERPFVKTRALVPDSALVFTELAQCRTD